jgi:hypothetical protein
MHLELSAFEIDEREPRLERRSVRSVRLDLHPLSVGGAGALLGAC